jgi:hypothetical protein
VGWEGYVTANAYFATDHSAPVGAIGERKVSNGASDTVSLPHNTVKNLASITVTAGTYIFIGGCIFAGNSSGNRELYFSNSATGGAIDRYNVAIVAANGNNQIRPQVVSIRSYTASSNTLYLNAKQNCGTALNATYPGITCVRIC